MQAKARHSLQSTCSPIHLGKHWAAAKPPSGEVCSPLGRIFKNLGEHWAAAKPPSGRFALHSVGF